MKTFVKKYGYVLFCACLMALFCSCTPTFHNIQEVDRFLEKERSSAKKAIAVEILDPRKRKKETAIGWGLTVANLIAGNFGSAAAMSPTSVFGGPGKTGPMELIGYVVPRRYVPVRRMQQGQLAWDLFAETKKRLGPAPESSACVFEGLGMFTSPVYTVEYKGEDGDVKMTKYIDMVLHFHGNPDSSIPCDKEAWKVYQDYLMTVGNITKNLIEEDDNFSRGIKGAETIEAYTTVSKNE